MSFEKALIKIADVDNLEIDTEAEHPVKPGEKAKDIYCAGWPVTKEGLLVTKSLLKNVFAIAIISVAIMIGDAVSGNICPEK